MNSSRTFAIVAGAVALSALGTQPALSATALEGSLFQQARAAIGSGLPVVVQSMNTWSAGAPEDLVAGATATATNGADSVIARAKMSAAWASADAGSVTVVDHGWTFNVPLTGRDGALADLEGDVDELDWTYSFVATEESTFELDFRMVGDGDLLGLGNWDLLFYDGGADPVVTELARGFAPYGPITASFSRSLVAGRTYKVALSNLDHTSIEYPTDNALFGKTTGRFDWRIVQGSTAVPEPAAWALMITGFGFAGGALRRRNRMAAAI